MVKKISAAKKSRLNSVFSAAKIAVAVLVIFSAVIVTTQKTSAYTELSDDQRGAITGGCATIKQSLKQLQKTDARSRSYLGSVYETILSSYVTPLDLRLISAGQPNASLTNLHSNLIETRKDFVAQYTAYSQSLDDLIGTDCYNHPEDFYDKLSETRKKRAELSATTTNFRNLLSEHLTAVRKIKSGLEGENDG